MNPETAQSSESLITMGLQWFFHPINDFLAKFDEGIGTYVAVGLFVGTMIWVGLILNRRYVNRGCPYKGTGAIWADLRFWTVISMLPHITVYLYFR